jgi:hypothetical protein
MLRLVATQGCWPHDAGDDKRRTLRADPRRTDSFAEAWLCQAFEQEADHGERHEGCDSSCVAFEAACLASIAADPSLLQDRETMEIAAPDDLDRPSISWVAIVVAILGPWHPGSTRMRSMKGKPCRVCCNRSPARAVLNVGGQIAYAEQEAEHVDKDVALAAHDFLARIEALRVERTPLFSSLGALRV